MRKQWKAVMISGAAATAIRLWMAGMPVAVQAQAGGQVPTPGEWPRFTVPRMADGRPNLNGIWQALVTANYNLEDHEAQEGPYTGQMGAYSGEPAGQSVVEGGVIPYRPEAVAGKAEVRERLKGRRGPGRQVARPGRPESSANSGVPRATDLGCPFKSVQVHRFPADHLRVRERHPSVRRTENRAWRVRMVCSRALVGATLVIESRSRKETWFDRRHFHSDALRSSNATRS